MTHIAQNRQEEYTCTCFVWVVLPLQATKDWRWEWS